MKKQAISESSRPSSYKDLANALRALSMDSVQKANSGHPGMPLGMADVATVLFTRFLKFDPDAPDWPDRDRFILSAGHGSMLLYSLLYLLGYPGIDLDQIKSFRQLGSRTAGHPEYGSAPGIEMTTGPLGQGLATAVGLALAERNMASRFSENVVDHHTYVIAGDGCLMEGISQEAISLAGHLRLNKLIVIYDSNGISIDGPTSLSYSDNASQRFKASGWDTYEADGHDPSSISSAINSARNSKLPSLIICNTTIGFGAPTKAGQASSHGAPLGDEEIAGTRESLGWDYEPFEIPEKILSEWRKFGSRGNKSRLQWQKKVSELEPTQLNEFNRLNTKKLPSAWRENFYKFKESLLIDKPAWATRVASQKVIESILPDLPELIGGSADLSGSNGTKLDELEPIHSENFAGRYIYYGVREHGMAAVMNGLSLHGGIIPYGGTFLVFSDYCRPAIRLSALMQQQVIYIMTHDSIGLGEDGPTHQPIEHLASLRAIPGVNVMRPADAIETAECWESAIGRVNGPTILALTRQGVPLLRENHTTENLCNLGAYVIKAADKEDSKVVLFASGSEVSIAIEAQNILHSENIPTRVVSVPCWELFASQEDSYRENLLGKEPSRVAVEAAVPMGWEAFVGKDENVVGMRGFGASAPANKLYKHFNITAEAIAETARKQL